MSISTPLDKDGTHIDWNTHKKFYTYQLKSSKGLQIVIKSIDASLEQKQIKESLEELGYNSITK